MTHVEVLTIRRNLWVILLQQIESNMEGPPDNATEDLLESLQTYIADLNRKIAGDSVTPQQLPRLKRAITQASDTMRHMQEHFAPLLDGFVYGSMPENNAQQVWAACVQMTTDLTKVVCGYEWQNESDRSAEYAN